MRTRAFLSVFLFAVSLPALADEENKKDDLKADMSYLEKKWSIKCKSCRIGEGNKVIDKKVTILVEFTKDVEDVAALRAALRPIPLGSNKPETDYHTLWFYFFDEENVIVAKSYLNWIEGDVTGKKGDAIRLVVFLDSGYLKKARKIEARPLEKKKTKDEAKKGK